MEHKVNQIIDLSSGDFSAEPLENADIFDTLKRLKWRDISNYFVLAKVSHINQILEAVSWEVSISVNWGSQKECK